MSQTSYGGPIEQIPPHLFDCVQHLLQGHLPVVPSAIPLGRLTTVLDVGCGMNQWGKALFRTMDQVSHKLVADVRIEGIDHHPDIIQAAGQHEDRTNVCPSFNGRYDAASHRQHPMLRSGACSLPIPYLAPQLWLTVLSEMVRVCKRGGWVIWMEPKLPTKGQNTPGWNQWLDWLYQAVMRLGGSPWITQSMEILVQQAGCQTHTETYTLPLFSCSPNGAVLSIQQHQLLCTGVKALFPLLLAAHVADIRKLEKVQGRVLDELYHQRITSQWEWTLVIGKKV